jgi:hypothetical protein
MTKVVKESVLRRYFVVQCSSQTPSYGTGGVPLSMLSIVFCFEDGTHFGQFKFGWGMFLPPSPHLPFCLL